MTDDDVQDEVEIEGEPDAPPRRGRTAMMVVLVGALVLGAGGGALVLGPLVAERVTSEPAPEVKAPIDVATYTVESLVLNPAETMGTRFLMATIVASVEGTKTAEMLQAREAEVRDRLMAVLGSKTVEQLSDVRLRESLREELRLSLGTMVEPARVLAVFLPTFVIQ
jgi:flagellar protein FliL